MLGDVHLHNIGLQTVCSMVKCTGIYMYMYMACSTLGTAVYNMTPYCLLIYCTDICTVFIFSLRGSD